MPHTMNAKKRMRQYAKRRKYNRSYRKAIKEQVKTFEAATPEQAQAEFVKAVKKLDKAAARGVIHANKAARAKSQLALDLNARKAAPATAK